MDQVRSINEVSYWITTSNGNTVPHVVEARSPVVAEGGMSVNPGTNADSKEEEYNERLSVLSRVYCLIICVCGRGGEWEYQQTGTRRVY